MDDELSRAFAALADPTRRDLVARLSLGDATVGQLAGPYAMSVQAVSKHLKVLEEAGLVRRDVTNRRAPCHLDPERLAAMTGWLDRYRRQADERFARLDDLLASRRQAVDPHHPHPGTSDVPPPEGARP